MAHLFHVSERYCSKPPLINSSVPQGSILSRTVFLLIINELSITECPNHSYADDAILQCSIICNNRPTQIELHNAWFDATERSTSDLSVNFVWGKKNLVSCNASKP